MAKLLFRLRHVTDEEAMEVRDLLAAHGFDTYETQAGFFRLGSMLSGCATNTSTMLPSRC